MTERGAQVTWRFTPWDSWFFRELRPWGAPGGAGAGSEFPPPAQTVAGAVRSAVAAHLRDKHPDVVQQVLAAPKIVGPHVTLNRSRLYPVPSALVSGVERVWVDDADVRFEPRMDRLSPPSAATACDRGHLLLPRPGLETLEQLEELDRHWLTREGMECFLRGGVPDPRDIKHLHELIAPDPRVGIARDLVTRTAADAALFSTAHVRLRNDVAVEIGLRWTAKNQPALGDLLPLAGNVKLGGEGRMASYETVEAAAQAKAPELEHIDDSLKFCLVFSTPASFGQPRSADWTRWHAVREKQRNFDTAADVWRCAPFGAKTEDPSFDIVSACTPTARYEGGYDNWTKTERDVVSLMPAGAVWFCLADDADGLRKARKLHGAQLGSGRDIGHGEVLFARGWGEANNVEVLR